MKAILTFHSIDDSGSVLSFPVRKFAQLITEVVESKTRICTLDQIVRPETDNAIAITFDDGMESVFKNALPVLKAAGVPAHLYLTTACVGGNNRWPTQPSAAPEFEMMNQAQLEHCVESGMLIENHTATHPDMRALSSGEVRDECLQADRWIDAAFGRKPKHFAYPYGYYNAEVAAFVGSHYETAVTTKLKMLSSQDSMAELPRLDTYYLQKRGSYRSFFSFQANTYLKLRNGLRIIRQMVS